MGFRFRRSIRLAPGIRLNLSSRGPSATVGPRGASINVGPRGTYANVGIPGTGLSSRTRLGPTGSTHPLDQEPPADLSPLFAPGTRQYSASRTVWPWILLGVAIGVILTIAFVG